MVGWYWCHVCSRRFYIDAPLNSAERQACPVCSTLGQHIRNRSGADRHQTAAKARRWLTLRPAEKTQVFGHCPECGLWFDVEDPAIEALYLCPTHLVEADRIVGHPVVDTAE